MEKNQHEEWLGRKAGDHEQQYRLNASSDHLERRDEEEDDDNAGEWGDVDPLSDHDGLRPDSNEPSGPGSAV